MGEKQKDYNHHPEWLVEFVPYGSLRRKEVKIWDSDNPPEFYSNEK
jgi:hypothetical protein